MQLLQARTALKAKAIEGVLRGFISDRYADHQERRAYGLSQDCRPLNLLLSQGYKRGLAWRGIPLGKTCWDVSIYQQLLQELKPKTLFEFGTGPGASALFFHDHCRMFGLDTKVITLDVNPGGVSPVMLGQDEIEFIAGDVRDLSKLLPRERLERLPHPWLVVEDCHMHIPVIVGHFQPVMAADDYLVIEDAGLSPMGSLEIQMAIQAFPRGTLMVDTFYTDMFGRNLTSCPDSIFRKM